jgi:hypothetical protein
MATSIAQKLRIKAGTTIHPLNAPVGYRKSLGTLPAKATLVDDAKGASQLHWFVLNRAQLEKELNGVLKLLKGDMLIWVFYPKGTSKLQTDLTRDKGWDKLLAHTELHWISLISFDDTWSTFAFRLKTDADRKKDEKPKERPIFEWIDPVKKIVRLPEDFAAALKKKKKEESYFNTLSFTNRKEYVEWIVTAKRPETRVERVKGSVERLAKGWKNPRNM